jgi:hypothetical protein
MSELKMEYLDARRLIQSGDVVGVEGNSFGASITRTVQRLAGFGECAKTTHVAMAWWLEGRLYLVEMDGKYNVLRPMSQYRVPMTLFKCPEENRAAVKDLFSAMTQDLIHYSMIQNVLTGLRILKRSKKEISDAHGENCSQFVARWYKCAGIDLQLPDDACPSEVIIALQQFKIGDINA